MLRRVFNKRGARRWERIKTLAIVGRSCYNIQGIASYGNGEDKWQRQERITATRAFPYRGRGVRAQRPGSIFGLTDWTAGGSTRCSRSSRTPSTRREGHGKVITSRITPTAASRWEDNGAAVPRTEPQGKVHNWELVYCELYAAAASTTISTATTTNTSSVFNGLGACATQYASR